MHQLFQVDLPGAEEKIEIVLAVVLSRASAHRRVWRRTWRLRPREASKSDNQRCREPKQSHSRMSWHFWGSWLTECPDLTQPHCYRTFFVAAVSLRLRPPTTRRARSHSKSKRRVRKRRSASRRRVEPSSGPLVRYAPSLSPPRPPWGHIPSHPPTDRRAPDTPASRRPRSAAAPARTGRCSCRPS